MKLIWPMRTQHIHNPSTRIGVQIGSAMVQVGSARRFGYQHLSIGKANAGVESLEPIFHCDAKPFALGTGVGLDTQCHNFVLPIPTCWYLKTLEICLSPNGNFKIT